ncbi:DUF1684 domain-containing protein [Thioclava sp. FR2]|uniref:DUF1684 domain-containing protein n=1 Tax=Thioclava sp. FR2 TaxID=3445780 RepID=UPI003EC1527F
MTLSTEDHRKEIDLWFQDRLKALKAEDGWLHLTDRVEIDPGRYRLGRDATNDLQISAGPDHLGILELSQDGLALLTTDQGALAFVAGSGGNPVLKVGGLLLERMFVEGQYALRVRDLTLPARQAFSDIPRYPVDPAWRMTAQWQALAAPEQVGIALKGGIDSSVSVTHSASFEHQGQTITLLVTHWKYGDPMFVFRDTTAGAETYGAARFLIGHVSGDQVLLDFNTAFNPPCAFTDYAVCPLPPRQNILSFPIRAGEMLPDQGIS